MVDDNDSLMQVCAMSSYGLPEVLQLQRLPRPRPAADQLLVRVNALAINPADCKQRSGNLRRVVKHTFPCILGQDFAGVVVEVGPRCTKFKLGDEVYGSTAPRNGCAAEYVSVHEREAALKPACLDWLQAAAVPTVACTGFKGIVVLGKACEGQRVLIHGASGGVGAAAAQIAVGRGCQVFGTCGPRNLEYVRSLNVTPLDYNTEFELHLEQASFDLVFDSVGGDEYFHRSQPLLRPTGLYVTAVGPVLNGGSQEVTYGQMLRTARTLLPRLCVNACAAKKYLLYLMFETEVLEEVSLLIEKGELCIRVDPESFDLSTMHKAHAKSETGSACGKLVVRVAEVS